MSTSVEALRGWRPEGLAGSAAAAASVQNDATRAAAHLTHGGELLSSWEGAAATGARATQADLAGAVSTLHPVLEALIEAIDQAQRMASEAVRLLVQAELEAASLGLVISADGLVVDPSGLGATSVAQVQAVVRESLSEADQGDTILMAALQHAVRAFAFLFDGLARSSARTVPMTNRLLPVGSVPAVLAGLGAGGAWGFVGSVPAAGVPATTDDIRSWWDGLTTAEQVSAVSNHPELVGATDGLPGWARDRANRTLLDRDEAMLVANEAALRPRPDGLLDGLAGAATIGSLGGGTRQVEYAQVVAKLAALRAVRQVLAARDGHERQLLCLDVSGRDAKVALAVGDVDRAQHVAVLVPGFTTTVGRDLVGADAAASSLADLAQRESAGYGDRGEVAVVTWMAYDAPQLADTLTSPHSVVLKSSAEAGAAALAPFALGLGAGRHVTLVGHSYGSTVAGLAVSQGSTGVDDLVVMGSPGVGVTSPAQLGMPADRVHVLEADDDPVADLGWFGGDPDRWPGVDLLGTSAGHVADGSNAVASHGHSQYLLPGTTSQWNVAAIVAGVPAVAMRPVRAVG